MSLKSNKKITTVSLNQNYMVFTKKKKCKTIDRQIDRQVDRQIDRYRYIYIDIYIKIEITNGYISRTKMIQNLVLTSLETEISCLQNPLILGLCPLQPPFKHRCPVVVKELSNSQKDLQFVKKTPAQVFPCEFCLIFKNNLVLKGLRLNYYL